MRTIACSLAVAVLSLLTAAAPAFADATTSPGKASVHASAGFLTMPGALSFSTVLNASILKAKKKQVLEVDGFLGDYNGSSADECIRVLVNGLDILEAQTPAVGGNAWACHPCSSTYFCSLTGQWWLDLDAAELAHPGVFIGQPLDIQLQAFSNVSTKIAVSLRARMVKK